ncbi:MAG: response regulator transcription factor [Acholeplasmataceae bacterium]|nr:response regulator transcription factor [Acholeplasmataceae bacterium]
MKQRILVVEDNTIASKAITAKLREELFDVRIAADGNEAIQAFDEGEYDAVLLDLILPGKNGEDVLKYIRSVSDVPVIIISAKDTDVEKAINLGLGADDYLSKPFSMLELIARVKAVLRRSNRNLGAPIKPRLSVKNLEINFNTFEVFKDGVQVDLTSKEFDILKLLVTNPEQTFSKQMIYRSIWGEEYYFNDNVINVHIRRLREKIEDDPSDPEVVVTKWGFGYRLGIVPETPGE